jgi:ribosomal protein S3
MKRARMSRKIYEQDQILDHIHKSYKVFDEQLDELEKERFEIIYESHYVDLFILTMHQELIVLKKFENIENEFTKTVKKQLKNKTILIKQVSL